MAFGVQVSAAGVKVKSTGVVIADAGAACCCAPPEACDSCVNLCYKLAGYTDGDLVPLAGFQSCASVYGGSGAIGVACNGARALSGVPWDGSFPLRASSSPALFGSALVCQWDATCDNTATGTGVQGNICVSNTLGAFITLKRSCTGGVATKTISITYVYTASPFVQRTLWAGTASSTDAELATTYTRTSGDDTTATLTVVKC